MGRRSKIELARGHRSSAHRVILLPMVSSLSSSSSSYIESSNYYRVVLFEGTYRLILLKKIYSPGLSNESRVRLIKLE